MRSFSAVIGWCPLLPPHIVAVPSEETLTPVRFPGRLEGGHSGGARCQPGRALWYEHSGPLRYEGSASTTGALTPALFRAGVVRSNRVAGWQPCRCPGTWHPCSRGAVRERNTGGQRDRRALCAGAKAIGSAAFWRHQLSQPQGSVAGHSAAWGAARRWAKRAGLNSQQRTARRQSAVRQAQGLFLLDGEKT